MAENQDEMSPIEMKVARQIEVILILKLCLYFAMVSYIHLIEKCLILTSSTTLEITIFRETSFLKNNYSRMTAGCLWRRCLNSTGLLFFPLLYSKQLQLIFQPYFSHSVLRILCVSSTHFRVQFLFFAKLSVYSLSLTRGNPYNTKPSIVRPCSDCQPKSVCWRIRIDFQKVWMAKN